MNLTVACDKKHFLPVGLRPDGWFCIRLQVSRSPGAAWLHRTHSAGHSSHFSHGDGSCERWQAPQHKHTSTPARVPPTDISWANKGRWRSTKSGARTVRDTRRRMGRGKSEYLRIMPISLTFCHKDVLISHMQSPLAPSQRHTESNPVLSCKSRIP